MNITKFDLCSRVSKRMRIPSTELKPVFESFLDEIITVLSESNRIELRGFGVFKVKTRKQRIGRNPRTGEQVSISSYLTPIFKFSKDGQKIFEHKLQKGLPKKVTKVQQPVKTPALPESTPAYSSKPAVQKTVVPKTVTTPKVVAVVRSADSFSPR